MKYCLIFYLIVGTFFLSYSIITQIPPMLKRGDNFPLKKFLWVAPCLLFGWMFISIKLLFDEIK